MESMTDFQAICVGIIGWAGFVVFGVMIAKWFYDIIIDCMED